MELKNQVVSLEIAKQLKSLGVKQDAHFYWKPWNDGSASLVEMKTADLGDTHGDAVSAFSVAELGELLPPMVKKEYNGVKEQIYKYIWENGSRDLWSVGYFTHDFKVRLQEFAPTEADARGKMLIYLLHYGLQDK